MDQWSYYYLPVSLHITPDRASRQEEIIQTASTGAGMIRLIISHDFFYGADSPTAFWSHATS